MVFSFAHPVPGKNASLANYCLLKLGRFDYILIRIIQQNIDLPRHASGGDRRSTRDQFPGQ
jgi:hypothetical protein